MADGFKAKGNAAFQAGNFDEAIEHFTEGIALAPENHVLYSNRSAAKASLQDYEGALEDAEQVVKIKADWPKGYSRLGGALSGLQRWDEAVSAYQKGLDIDPQNAALKGGLSEAEAGKRRSAGSGGGMGSIFGPEFMAKLAQNPQTRGYLSQPDFVAMMQDMSSNPGNMNKYLGDPRFQAALQAGLGLNVMSGDQFADEQKMGGAEEAAAASAPQQREKPSAPEPPPAPEPEPALSEEEEANAKRKADALAEKEQGNAAYKKKDFQSAVQHYDRALELFDGDISFLTNRAAVYFEMGEYEKVVADCTSAVERGRELRADYKMVARALTRKGNALLKMGDLPAAIEAYHKALTEHRNPDTLAKLQAAEKALKAEQESAYINMDVANTEKEAGNEAFKGQRYPEAVQHYTEALKRGPPAVNPEAHKLYSNRAACYTKLGAWKEGLKDAEECIKLEPTFIKGYSRKGHLEFFMKDYDAALETYEAGLKQDPDSEELKEGRMRTIQAMTSGAQPMTDEERKLKQQKAMADPEIQGILTDPIMRQVLDDFQNDPPAAQRHLKAPQIMAKLQKLIKAGIVQMA